MSTGASARFEFRLRQQAKQRIEHAARLVDESASDFVREAAERSADAILVEHDAITIVPAEFFDQLISALEEKPNPSAALTRAGKRARRAVRR